MSDIDLSAYKDMHLSDIARSFGVELTPVGDKLRGLCPFHSDHSTPSFYIFSDEHYYCFGCRAYGHATDFLAAMSGTTPRRVAASWLKHGAEKNEPLKLKLPTLAPRNYKNALALFAAKWYNALPENRKDIAKLKALDDLLYSHDHVNEDEYSIFVDVIKSL